LGLPRWAALGVLASGPVAARVALPAGRLRQYAVFLAQMWGYLRAFELTYAHPETLRRRLRVDYPIALDRIVGAGTLPGVRLQALRADERLARVLDRAMGVVYFSWALERHAVLLHLITRHPERFPRAAALVAASFDVGWAIYSVFPTAPPWWAAKHGRIQGLHRVTVDASRAMPLVPRQSEEDSDQANPWASMPSTHTASAAMIALVAWEADARVGTAAIAYVCALGVALVYLGEHYAVDVLAGVALTAAIRALEPPARALACDAKRSLCRGASRGRPANRAYRR
jgi:membrane-associated phospholipid phosphatase